MKVLVLVSSLDYGSAEKQSVTEANALATQHEVYVAAFRGGPLLSFLKENIHRQIFDKGNYVLSAFRLARFCRKHRIKVIHAHLHRAMLISAITSLFYSMDVFWTFYDRHHEDAGSSSWILQLLSRLPTVKKVFFVGDDLIAQNARDRRQISEQKVKRIQNYSGTSGTSSLDRPCDNKVVIGSVAKRMESKQIGLLIEAAKFLLYHGVRNFEIWIMCDVVEREAMQQQINDSNLTSWFRCLCLQGDVEKCYRRFDLLALPGEEEDVSLPLIEAGVWGIPAVAFDTRGNSEMIASGSTGLLVRNRFEFRDKILMLVLDEEDRIKQGERALNFTRTRFTNARYSSDLETAFDDLN